MKPYARNFYNGRAWRSFRESYVSDRMTIDGALCERCHQHAGEELHHIEMINPDNINNPGITLNRDNVTLLCRQCHFEVHRELILQSFQAKARQHILNEKGYYFDEEGQMKMQEVVIVAGPPGAGKTTYVEEHRASTDLIIDLDRIAEAIGRDGRDGSNNLLDQALGIRDYLYEQVEQHKVDCMTVWIIAGLPTKKERAELVKRLNAKLVLLDVDKATCEDRIKRDQTVQATQLRLAVCENYFEKFQK